ncbi:MAG: peptide chain release factor N(5)-glutamine methyltransferase [Gemmatimonadota bacterium]
MPEIALPLAQKATQLLAERGIDNARLEAELLLAHVLGIKRLDLYLQFDRPLTETQLEEFRRLVRRRLKREPLQYITGRAQFRELELKVDRHVLIPRPETEVLVGVVLDYIDGRPVRVLEVGVGSGAIALSIAKEARNASVVATDISGAAAEVAALNARDNGLVLDIRIGSLFDPLAALERFDVIVSNPPYVADHERDSLQPEVKDWEPASALFAGDDGLGVFRALVSQSPSHMVAAGLLALEVGSSQAQQVAQLIDKTEKFEAVSVTRDLSGRDRIVSAVRKKI